MPVQMAEMDGKQVKQAKRPSKQRQLKVKQAKQVNYTKQAKQGNTSKVNQASKGHQQVY